ncbi:tumor necrosis factor receptor superfamily member 4 [Ascaphus truei]|uniref:tumor necrosis factor receptor superfamily member 4 n=1 Tax=Ascaphus truei TaxID=8439 RepID=UPI003F5A9696
MAVISTDKVGQNWAGFQRGFKDFSVGKEKHSHVLGHTTGECFCHGSASCASGIFPITSSVQSSVQSRGFPHEPQWSKQTNSFYVDWRSEVTERGMEEVCLRLPILLSVLLTTQAMIQCPGHQHPFSLPSGRKVCCDNCAAGEEMRARCSENTKTVCKPCPEKFYNPPNRTSKCNTCNYCDTGSGSIEVKPCDKSSDAVCRCPTGSTRRNDKQTMCLCEKGKQIVSDA